MIVDNAGGQMTEMRVRGVARKQDAPERMG